MATQNLNLESQEQLDQIKYFWNKYGNLITTAVVVAALAILGWQYYQKVQRDLAAQASNIYAELQTARANKDAAKVERAFSDLKAKYASTAYTEQAALATAQALQDSKPQAAKDALKWLADNGKQPGYRALAKLRLSALALQAKSYDEALKYLDNSIPPEFAALAADRRGDIYMAQNKADLAKAEYSKAYKDMTEEQAYRSLIEIKLNALGVDVKSQTATADKTGAAQKAGAPVPAASAAQ